MGETFKIKSDADECYDIPQLILLWHGNEIITIIMTTD